MCIRDRDKTINIEGLLVQPIRVIHGQLPVFGFRFGDFTYLTDLNNISAEELAKVAGTKFLAIDALHHSEHHSHFNLEQALDLIKIIQPEQAYLIHVSHRMGLAQKVNDTLPKGVQLAYDGQILTI